MLETGQDWKIAALIVNFYVHFYFGVIFMNLQYMDLAISEAEKAMRVNEVPVGCVIVHGDEVIATAYNQKETLNDATKHAEMIAITEASEKMNNWRLEDCDIYITLEPCPMCASAIKQARLRHVFCGLANSDFSNSIIIQQIFEKDKNNKKVLFTNNLAVEKVELLLKKFFLNRRNK